MTDKSKKLLKLFVRIAITSGLLVWVFNRIDISQLGEAFKAAKWQYLIAVWATVATIYWINSIKMRLILKEQDCYLNTTKIFGISAVTALYSMVMPGMLSMGMKWYFLRKNTGKGINVFSSMLYNQLSNAVFMAIFGLGALILTNPSAIVLKNTKNHFLLPVFCGILLVTIVLFCVLLLNNRTGSKIINLIDYLSKPLPEKIRQKIRQILDQIALFQTAGWKFHIIMFLITIGGTSFGGVIMYIFAAKAANVIVPFSIFAWLWAIIFIMQRVPISIANLGVREATLATILPIYGVEPPKAVMMSMMLFSALVFMAVIGAVFNFSGFMTGVRQNETV
ncbi:MAG: flippase-like domain-containing protein [Sedimentisphaerales bacterium]|nr:flippase-like domain-containing protein [Sedimentisphaerales bacterium]